MNHGSKSTQKRVSASSRTRKERKARVGGTVPPGSAVAKVTPTAGETFPSAVIELIGNPADSSRPNLLFWDGSSAVVGPRVSYRRTAYEPVALEPSVVRTMPWPERPLKYGSTSDLFNRVLGLITQHVALQDKYARLLTYFVFSTWFPDRLSLSPGLAILGPADGEGVELLRILRCLCRRSMLLGDVSQANLLSLPLHLSPTLLMNRPMLTRRLRSFLSTSNRRGLGTMKGEKVVEICCPKAIYFGMDPIPPGIASVMIQVAMASSATQKATLDERILNEITAEIQGKMLGYRLADYLKVRPSDFSAMNFTPQTREIAMNLASCIVGDAKLADAVVPLLQQQDDHVRGQADRKFDAAILAAVLTCLHEKQEKKDRVQVKELAGLANTLLRTQGEIVEYQPEEVGHRLDGLSLGRTRQSQGMFLLLDRETSRLVHRLAAEYGQKWSANSACPDCEEQPQQSENNVGYVGYVGYVGDQEDK